MSPRPGLTTKGESVQEEKLMGQARRHDIVTFEQISKTFRIENSEFTAIQDVSLTVKRGDFVTLLGPSGCGKSTLLNLTAGLIRPTSGRLTYDGGNVGNPNPTQADHLLSWRTVAGNVAIPFEISGMARSERKDRVATLLQLVGLSDFARYYPSQLSGGMKKRVALARLLAANREMLLLDEPFGGLDAQLRLTLQSELRKLYRQFNKTVLFVTHDVEEAAALSDVCVVFEGRPGTIAKVIENPLPRERNLMTLRFEKYHHDFTNELWRMLTPEFGKSGEIPGSVH
jgi:NitT/TauT family transport system ATP-binding protein